MALGYLSDEAADDDQSALAAAAQAYFSDSIAAEDV